MRPLIALPIAVLALAAISTPAATAATAAPTADPAAKQTATKKRCPQGAVPIVRERGRRLVAVRDARGRLRCRALRRPGKPPAPSATQAGQAASVTAALERSQAISPGAIARLQRAVGGRKRAGRVVDVTLEGWKRAAGAALSARASGDTETIGFRPGAGVEGQLVIGQVEAGGDDSGSTTTATATIEASRDGIRGLAPGVGDKLPADLKSVRGEARVSFEDKIAACPSDRSERRGRLKARGSVRVTVERDGKPPVVVEQSVEVEMTYTVGAEGTIDVQVEAVYSSGGSGVPTQTYRVRRFGRGFGRDAILDSRDVAGAIDRDYARFDDAAGGVFGPKGGWNFARGIGYSDLRSLENVKAMATALVNTDLLTLAALEYARKVALRRAEREECDYVVSLNVKGDGIFATHDATGQIAWTAKARQVGDRAWHAEGAFAWTGLVFTPKDECARIDPVSDGWLMVDVDRDYDGTLQVTWSHDRAVATASVDCPSTGGEFDPPPVPGQPGPGLPGIAPASFELPADGGSQKVSGGVQARGEGFYNDGVLTVTRVK